VLAGLVTPVLYDRRFTIRQTRHSHNQIDLSDHQFMHPIAVNTHRIGDIGLLTDTQDSHSELYPSVPTCTRTTDLQHCYSNPGLPRIILAISCRLSGPHKLNCRLHRRNRRLAALPKPTGNYCRSQPLTAHTRARSIGQAARHPLHRACPVPWTWFLSALCVPGVSIIPFPTRLTLSRDRQDIHFFKMVTASHSELSHLFHRFCVV
jgi:hypothetical protein